MPKTQKIKGKNLARPRASLKAWKQLRKGKKKEGVLL